MAFSEFIKLLCLPIIASVAIFFGFNLFLPISPYLDFLGGSVLFFSFLAIMVFLLAGKSARLEDGSTFLVLIIGNVFVKLITAFLVVAIYAKYKEPTDRFFLVPFLITYLSFMIYEIYFLSIQARQTK